MKVMPLHEHSEFDFKIATFLTLRFSTGNNQIEEILEMSNTRLVYYMLTHLCGKKSLYIHIPTYNALQTVHIILSFVV